MNGNCPCQIKGNLCVVTNFCPHQFFTTAALILNFIAVYWPSVRSDFYDIASFKLHNDRIVKEVYHFTHVSINVVRFFFGVIRQYDDLSANTQLQTFGRLYF